MIELDRNTIRINEYQYSFELPIVRTMILGDLVIVLLGVHPKISDVKNVYAINNKCEIVWQINGVIYEGSDRNSIIYLYEKKDDLDNWYLVSLEDGTVKKVLKKDVP